MTDEIDYCRLGHRGALRCLASLNNGDGLVIGTGNHVVYYPLPNEVDNESTTSKQPTEALFSNEADAVVSGICVQEVQPSQLLSGAPHTYFNETEPGDSAGIQRYSSGFSRAYYVITYGIRCLRVFALHIREASQLQSAGELLATCPKEKRLRTPLLHAASRLYYTEDRILTATIVLDNAVEPSTNQPSLNGHKRLFTLCLAFSYNYVDVLHAYRPADTVAQASGSSLELVSVTRICCPEEKLLYGFSFSPFKHVEKSSISALLRPNETERRTDNDTFFDSRASSYYTCFCASGTVDSEARLERDAGSVRLGSFEHAIFCVADCNMAHRNPLDASSGLVEYSIKRTESTTRHPGMPSSTRPVSSVAYKTDQKQASDDREIRVWTAPPSHGLETPEDNNLSARELAVLQGHQARVWDFDLVELRFEKTKKTCYYLVSAGEDTSCLIWNITHLTDAKPALSPIHKLSGHTGRGVAAVIAVPYSRPDASNTAWVASAGMDGELKVWNMTEMISLLEEKENGEHDWNNDDALNETQEDAKQYPFLTPTKRGLSAAAASNAGDLKCVNIRSNLSSKITQNDWVRDVVLTSTRTGFFTTNFGIVVAFTIRYETTSTKNCIDVTSVYSSEDKGVIFTCLASKRYDLFSPSFGLSQTYNENQCLFLGTATGECHILISGGDASFSQKSTTTAALATLRFSVISNSRVNKVFAFSLPSHSSHTATTTSSGYKRTLLIVTDHKGTVCLYVVDEGVIQSQGYGTLESPAIQPLGTSSLPGLKENRIFSCAAAMKNQCTVALFLGDEFGSVWTKDIQVDNFTHNQDSSDKTNSGVSECWRRISHLPTITRQPLKVNWIGLTFTCDASFPNHALQNSIRSVHTATSDGFYRTFHLRIQEENASYVCSHNNSTGVWALSQSIKMPHLNAIWKPVQFQENYNPTADCLDLIAGFNGADCIFWSTSASAEVWRFRCGGARRPLSLNAVVSPNGDRQVTVTWAKGPELFFRTRTFGISKNVSDPKPYDSSSGVRFCHSLIPGVYYHGREVTCGIWTSPYTFCTGSLDGTVKELTLSSAYKGESPIQGSTFTDCVLTHCDHPAAVLCMAKCSVNCVQPSGIAENVLDSIPFTVQFVITGGARQVINIYYTAGAGQRTPQPTSPHQVASFPQLIHLLKYSLPLKSDERILCISSTGDVVPWKDFPVPVSGLPENTDRIVLTLFLGTSSGRLFQLEVFVSHKKSHSRTSDTLASAAFDSVVVLEHSALLTSVAGKLKGAHHSCPIQSLQITQHHSALLSCEFLRLPSYSTSASPLSSSHCLRKGYLIVGCVKGFVTVYPVTAITNRRRGSEESCFYLQCDSNVITYQAHTAGVTGIAAMDLSKIFFSFNPSHHPLQGSDSKNNGHAAHAPCTHTPYSLTASPRWVSSASAIRSTEFRCAKNQDHEADPIDVDRIFIATVGDDTALNIHSLFILRVSEASPQTPTFANESGDGQIETDHQQAARSTAFRIPLPDGLQVQRCSRAHGTSIRGVSLSFPWIVTLGWDRNLRIWKCAFSGQNASSSVFGGFSLVPRLARTIATPIHDAAGLAVWKHPVAQENLTNKASLEQKRRKLHVVVFGALGIDVSALIVPEQTAQKLIEANE